MAVIVFPGITFDNANHGRDWVPLVSVSLRNDKKERPFLMLVDSGAFLTVLPQGMGGALGFRRVPNERVYQANSVHMCPVDYVKRNADLVVNGYVVPIRIGWSLSGDVAPVLGRLDLFDAFDIEFRQSTSEVIFKPLIPPSASGIRAQ